MATHLCPICLPRRLDTRRIAALKPVSGCSRLRPVVSVQPQLVAGAFDDPELMAGWVKVAYEAALRTRTR